ncbi:hypothetical protein [Natranaerobius trueperi]|uniref:Uncharacterized protein n=1 Tax=Natranaerobius trueperi TaxID=759412 RepID=A0A226C245_9FIRM|nr:hypothetical protein [Natranaerobius trueperi]OWZ84664.1 hypothetical protein CDO51_02570 [Natranaerobius trueperi]
MNKAIIIVISFLLLGTSNILFAVEEKRPEVVDRWPYGDEYYNEDNIDYIKITFDDEKENLEFLGIADLRDVQVIPETIGSNRVDLELLNDPDKLEEKFVVKDSSDDKLHIKIPVTNLVPDTTYEVIFPSGVVMNSLENVTNEEIKWEFETIHYPRVTTEDFSKRNFSEDYSYSERLRIDADKILGQDVDVYFNNRKAHEVEVDTDDDDNRYLEVLLPRYNRLEPGIYDVLIKNSDDHKTKIYGAVSIIESKHNDFIPKEDTRVTDRVRQGKIVEEVGKSKKTLEVSRYYSNWHSLNFNLDDFMSPNTRERVLSWIKREDDRLDLIDLIYQGFEYSFIGLDLDSDYKRDDVQLTIEKVGSHRKSYLKNRLNDYVIKSDFYELSKENLLIDFVTLEIPFESYESDELKVLRFDEDNRQWTEDGIYFPQIHKRDQLVKIIADELGTFVVVSEGRNQ